MDKKWQTLMRNFEEMGYKPHDIQRIVMLYEMMQENDQLLKKTLEEENEHSN